MYKVKKDTGLFANVFLVNEDTMTEVNLGRLTSDIGAILAKDGYALSTILDTAINPREAFCLTISTEVYSELARLAMPMKKPNRSKKPVKKTEESKDYADAYEMIFG